MAVKELGEVGIGEIIRRAWNLRVDRARFYGENWRKMSLRSLYCGALYKLERSLYTENREKKIDDLFDALNYIIFILKRLGI